jgi:hypothetical protein
VCHSERWGRNTFIFMLRTCFIYNLFTIPVDTPKPGCYKVAQSS